MVTKTGHTQRRKETEAMCETPRHGCSLLSSCCCVPGTMVLSSGSDTLIPSNFFAVGSLSAFLSFVWFWIFQSYGPVLVTGGGDSAVIIWEVGTAVRLS